MELYEWQPRSLCFTLLTCLILIQPADAARKTRYHLCLYFFWCEHKLGGFHVISHSNSKSVGWKFPVNTKLNIAGFDFWKYPVCQYPCFACEVSHIHFCPPPQHPWQWLFLKLEQDRLVCVLYFLLVLWQIRYHPNDVNTLNFSLVSSDFLRS